MPEKHREYVEFEIQEIIDQVKSYGFNHSFYSGWPARFSTPNQTMQRLESLAESQSYIVI